MISKMTQFFEQTASTYFLNAVVWRSLSLKYHTKYHAIINKELNEALIRVNKFTQNYKDLFFPNKLLN